MDDPIVFSIGIANDLWEIWKEKDFRLIVKINQEISSIKMMIIIIEITKEKQNSRRIQRRYFWILYLLHMFLFTSYE